MQSTVSILRKCVPKQTLPLANLFSAYQYTLPTDSQSGAIKRQEQPSLETGQYTPPPLLSVPYPPPSKFKEII